MAHYLSDDWHSMVRELARELPSQDGVSIRIAFVVTGGPTGDCTYHQVIENGRIVEQANGPIADVDVTMTVSWADGVAMHKGELDPNVAMMQGRAKIAGNMGKVIAILPLSTSTDYQRVQEKVRAQTQFAEDQ